MRQFLILILVSALFAGCGTSSLTSVSDDRPTFRIAPEKGFQIAFGRGSGWHGLDTVSVDDAGTVTLHKISDAGIIRSSFTLVENDLNAVLSLVDECGVMDFDREYHDETVVDGTQWVLLVEQGEKMKSIYFNNHFPEKIHRFALQFDSILDAESKGLETITVEIDPISDRLWDSIKD